MYVLHACMHVIIYTYTYMQTLLLQLRQPPPFPHAPPAQVFPKKTTKCVETPEEIAFLPQSCFSTQHDMKDGEGGVGQPQVPYNS